MEIEAINSEFKDRLLNLSVSGIYVYDVVVGLNVYLNDQYTALTGYTLEDINGMTQEEFFGLFHPEEQQMIGEHMGEVIGANPGTIIEIEYRFRKKNGDWMWCLSRDSVFEQKDESTTKFMGTFIDITAKKDLEFELSDTNKNLELKVKDRTRELELAKQNLEESNERLSEFSYLVSHDLKAPLRRIGQLCEFIEEDVELPEEAEDHFKLIQKTTGSMNSLIDDLLTYSKVQSIELSKNKVPLSELISAAKGRLMDQTFELEIDSELIGVEVDSIRFTEALYNLLENGLKYNKSSSKKIKIEFDNKSNILSIQDNGIGIDSENFATVLEPFKRLHSSSEYEGSGIGLAIVRRILDRHGVSVTIESELETGSTFNLDLSAVV